MINALWITLIGMGLVFVAILILWGLMALLVRVTTPAEAPQEAQGTEAPPPAAPGAAGQDTQRRAAAAAVAVALALQGQSGAARANPHAAPQAGVSAWQALNRARQINQRANLSRKKETR